MDKKTEERVAHPSYYTWLKKVCGIEVIDITRHMGFNLGNVVKYILRSGYKKEEGLSNEEKGLEDLKKAAWYLNDEIKKRDSSVVTEINEYQKTIENLKQEIEGLKKNKTKVLTIAKTELLKAAKTIENYPDIPNAITFKQSRDNGIGSGTSIQFVTYNRSGELVTIDIDITDYDLW